MHTQTYSENQIFHKRKPFLTKGFLCLGLITRKLNLLMLLQMEMQGRIVHNIVQTGPALLLDRVKQLLLAPDLVLLEDLVIQKGIIVGWFLLIV